MFRDKFILLGLSAFALVLILLGLFLVNWPLENTSLAEQEQPASVTVDLGVTYVPITSGMAAYYNQGVIAGALVTEVVQGSPADKAGVEVGDIILSFNGTKVEEETPLLGMMRACSADSGISLELQSEMNTRKVEIARR